MLQERVATAIAVLVILLATAVLQRRARVRVIRTMFGPPSKPRANTDVKKFRSEENPKRSQAVTVNTRKSVPRARKRKEIDRIRPTAMFHLKENTKAVEVINVLRNIKNIKNVIWINQKRLVNA